MKVGLIIFGIVSFFTVSAQGVDIVNNKTAKATLVIAENNTTSLLLANRLNDYFLKISDTKLPIITQSKFSLNSKANVIYLLYNDNRYRALLKAGSPDSFVIKNLNNNEILIYSNSGIGLEFGVSHFLEKFLNVAWLMPTHYGLYFERKSTINIPYTNMIYIPSFRGRQLSPIDIDQKADIHEWGRLNKLYPNPSFHHNMSFFIDQSNAQNLDDSFFSKYNGKIHRPKSKDDIDWQPDFSNSKFLNYSSDKVKVFFGKNTDKSSISLGINDSRKTADGLVGTRRNYLNLSSYSDIYYNWVDKLVTNVNRSYPGKRYGLLAYYNVSEPPTFKIVNKNQIVPFITFERQRWLRPEYRKQDQQLTIKWKQSVNEIGWYDYVYGKTYLFPRASSKLMNEYLKWANANGVKYYYGEIYPNWGEGPRYWVLSKLLWDSSLNSETLTGEWCIKAVGNTAGQYLKLYYSKIEDIWNNKISQTPWFNRNVAFLPYNDLDYFAGISESDMKTLDGYMKEVISNNADADPNQKNRAKLLKNMWDFYYIAFQCYKKGGFKYIKDLAGSNDFMNSLNTLKANPLHYNSYYLIKSNL